MIKAKKVVTDSIFIYRQKYIAKNLFPRRLGLLFNKPKKLLFSRLIKLFKPIIVKLIDKELVLLKAFNNIGNCIAVVVKTGGEIFNFIIM